MRLTTVKTLSSILLFPIGVAAFLCHSYSYAYSFDEIIGNIDMTKHDAFIQIPRAQTLDATPRYMRKEAYESRKNMVQAAKSDGIDLKVISATRSYTEQVQLFKRYSYERAMPPGTSSHNFGTAVDIYQAYSGSLAYAWLTKHAHHYGFCQTYDGSSSEQIAEPRHREYKPELHRQLLSDNIDALYIMLVSKGFVPETMTKQELMDSYLFGVSTQCIQTITKEKTTSFHDLSRYTDAISNILFVLDTVASTSHMLVYTISRDTSTVGVGTQANYMPKNILVRMYNGTPYFVRNTTTTGTEAKNFNERSHTKTNALLLSRFRMHIKKRYKKQGYLLKEQKYTNK